MNINPQIPTFPEIISEKYQILQEMGRGAFSTVYKIQSKSANKIYCLKKINLKKTTDKKNEINILSKLSHPNLVRYITSIIDKEGIYIIMEFCEYGDLYSLLHSVRKKKVYVNEDIIWDIAYQCLLALEYLHSQNVIHRDIKLLNILMAKDKVIKIGDMGMSKLLTKKEMKMSRVGTPLYLPPELVKKERYDYKADIWSLGCSLYHLAKTVPPFNDENLIRLGQAIVNEQPPSLPDCYTDKLFQFVLKLMTKDKHKRPSATEAIDLIPDRIKNKYNKHHNNNRSNTANNKNSNNYLNKEGGKKKNLNNNNLNDNNGSVSTSSSNNNIINNNNIHKNGNVLSAGKTFYKWFKGLPEKRKSLQSRRTNRIISTNNVDDKLENNTNSNVSNNINANVTQHGFFDSKFFSSNIMSKSMSGTQEGFFKRKELRNNPTLISNNDNISTRDKFQDSKGLNMLFNNNENDLIKADMNINVLKLDQENLRSKRLGSSHAKKEENKNEFKNFHIDNGNNNVNKAINNKKPIVVKSEDFNNNINGFLDQKNNTNLIFPIIQNNNRDIREKNFRSKISMMNKNKLKQKAENSGFNFFRKTYNFIPNKVLTIHDLK